MKSQLDLFPEDLAQRHLDLTKQWAGQIGWMGVITSILALVAMLAATFGAPWFLVLPLITGFVFSCIITMVLIRSLEWVRYTLSVQLVEWQRQQATNRVLALRSTPNINVRGRNNTVSVSTDNSTKTVENTRLIQYRTNVAPRSDTHIHLIDGVDQRDLEYFIDQVPLRGIAVRSWMRKELPSGRVLTKPEEYRALIAILVKAGIVKDRTERSSGVLTITDPQEMRKVLGITAGQVGHTTETSPDNPNQPD